MKKRKFYKVRLKTYDKTGKEKIKICFFPVFIKGKPKTILTYAPDWDMTELFFESRTDARNYIRKLTMA